MAVSYLGRLVIVREIGPRLGNNQPAAPMTPRVFIMGFPGVDQTGKARRPQCRKILRSLGSTHEHHGWQRDVRSHAARRHLNASLFGLNPGFIRPTSAAISPGITLGDCRVGRITTYGPK